MKHARWCPNCEVYVDAVPKPRCFGEYCRECDTACISVPDAREPEAFLQEAVRILGLLPPVCDGGHPDVAEFLDLIREREANRC